MQDTADTTQAAGQPDASTTDAAQQPDAQPGSGTQDTSAGQQPQGADPWADPDAARKEIEKLRRESASWRTKYREAEPQLTEYQQWQESQKTEQQKLHDAKEAAERELGDLRATNTRLMAAATHNIPPDLIDLLGSGSDDEINARAEMLAERLKASAPTPSPTSQRPVEALTPGAATASGAATTSPDEWIRRMAGR
ncbi:hypothetical protein [Streptomyces anthocyanicus]|uniref:hypothetical protein n=1 Tax=Streptomyces anthocyanicus TaxID=68174 RepID=UPI00381508BE|nr:hypothetical protein OHA15_34020 [Streptomyces anthocyanicus]